MSFDPFDKQQLTAHLNSDPELKANMLKHELVRGPFQGEYWLSPKGEAEFTRRGFARQQAILKNIVSEGPAND